MRPEVLEPLANTLEMLAARGPNGMFIEALWVGTAFRETVHVTPKEMGQLARSSQLSPHTRYGIIRDGAG
jgi:hypothetical protein